MRKLFFLGILTSVLLFSCSKDETTSLVADFTATVTGESPNAQVAIINNSTGATTYNGHLVKELVLLHQWMKNQAPLQLIKQVICQLN